MMPTRDNYIEEINETLGDLNTFSLIRNPKMHDIFEVYVFKIILDAVKKEHGRIFHFEDIHGHPTNRILFRTQPGYIFSTNPPNRTPEDENYTHAVIGFRGKPPLEVHTGIRVQGKSGVLHECDVAVLARAEGVTCRNAQVFPRYSKVLLAVECKFYAAHVKLNLAREFIGFSTDISTGGDGKSLAYFVVNTSSTSCEKLLTNHNKKWEHHISPEGDNEVDRLRNAFQTHFRNYQSL